jgi:hypothetical protein
MNRIDKTNTVAELVDWNAVGVPRKSTMDQTHRARVSETHS